MNFKEIKELIEILDQSSLTEINIEDNKGSVVNLKKEKETEIITPQYTQQAPLAPAASTMATPNQSATESPVPQNNDQIDTDDSSYQTINAPMVGTFYKSPSPEEDAYVQVGDKVTNESTVCILEAMKLFNEIQAEVSGEIVEILVEDGQMVEYGQPLFKVK
ncbi:acetyl-CoA carboxylase biotin carboxyl carrier protein [Staphylococcus haemolyticus]|uniref:acetyl-CoA carboxylase biotin carboxyl carrier protein n=1 Tax=Staphylococcus haemolyticus TaxID=1283 RepID=UPI001F0AD66F|nr:acetyl-CoA carboxylase biotin carboxyl carrier protein [Staphylococcus haemolyticus]MCH4459689.1 acetyl-CoA carboxylase biotin carboxyl carrier protein [Staphylococcus haemolyticus]MCH4483125.1 acetyl-CoA carboxylase biotin carboxyl carrier protein [Staphylococcus haemolyticus]